MDFTIFDEKEHINALAWLGRRNWLEYHDIPDQRSITAKPKKLQLKPKNPDPNALIVSEKEYKKHPQEMWDVLQIILNQLEYDVIGSLWYNTLARSLADGPKIFRPTKEQCEALQHAEARYSFQDYHQPFPVIILEVPEEYREFLKEKYHIDESPKYALIQHDENNRFITVSAFYAKNNIIIHITPDREEYKLIEDSIVKNRDRRKDSLGSEAELAKAEFDAAENVHRLGINFAMMMSLYSVKVSSLIDAGKYRLWQQESEGRQKNGQLTKRATEAKVNLAAAMQVIEFDQQVSFYDEIEENVVVGQNMDIEQLKRSPKSHWRRGHFAMQPCGVGRRERKMIFRKPVLVRANYFIGEAKDASVTYTMQERNQ